MLSILKKSSVRSSTAAVAMAIARRNYNVPINEVKRGLVLTLKNRIWQVSDTSFHTQGRRGSHYNVGLKDLQTGKQIVERFNSGSSVDAVDLDVKGLKFMYAIDKSLHMIDPESYEEVEVPLDLIPGGQRSVDFLSEDNLLKVHYYQGRPLQVSIPLQANVKVVETAPAPSSSTNESQKGMMFKPAILANGVTISVPEFIQSGDEIVCNINPPEYYNRISIAGKN